MSEAVIGNDKNFGVLWHSGLKHKYPNFTFYDGFDAGESYWSVDLSGIVVSKSFKYKGAKQYEEMGKEYPDLFHEYPKGTGHTICTGWIMQFYLGDDEVIASVESMNTPIRYEFTTKSKLDFDYFTELTEEDFYRIATDTGAIDKMIEVLDKMQADVNRFLEEDKEV